MLRQSMSKRDHTYKCFDCRFSDVPPITKQLNHFFHALGKCLVLQKYLTVLFISIKHFAGAMQARKLVLHESQAFDRDTYSTSFLE